MKKTFIILLLSVTVLYASQNDHIRYGTPGENGTILSREGYILLHNNSKKAGTYGVVLESGIYISSI